ncbi:unnamed protein product [Adineta steineri]|uniref:Uncharacterized protein n=1 Tax=Adineta steineri TaxID=433720 RepID=A0A815AFN9_9BILA|nr:unnamed protein product [Adineta steineri]CAF3988051.1 unnamed protein product [Adineta steineri]
MGSSPSSFSNFEATIQIKDGITFRISYADLVDHVLLLRKVISHPEMTEQGVELDYFIQDYCKRMAQQEMISKKQQLKLPWQIEWIWHVHRLHPIAYFNDCTKQLQGGNLVDKLAYNLIEKRYKKHDSKTVFTSIKNDSSFVPSIDLTQAVIRQRYFLQNFQKHDLSERSFKQQDLSYFEQLVQNYVLFFKLARENEMIIPTSDIDIIWHSHMRRPVHYRTVSKALCGFVLDHDDAIEQSILSNNYQKTAERWKQAYNTDYDHDIDRKNIESSRYVSSCAAVGSGWDSICAGGGGCGGDGEGDGGGCGEDCED